MKSKTTIKVAMNEITEFFAALDHLKITDETMIRKLFKENVLDQHCIDFDAEELLLDPEGELKNELFRFEMLYRELSI